MPDLGAARKALVARILEGPARAPEAQRRAAFDAAGLDGALGALVEKVRRRAHAITDEDIGAVRGAGLEEDEVFELVVCAAVGEATRRCEAALASLRAAAGQPRDVDPT